MAAPRIKTIYLASPIATYETPDYARKLAQARVLFGTAYVLPARGLYPDAATFEREWPNVLEEIDGLVFFTDRGTIGKGVWREIHDARTVGLPVWRLTGGRLVENFKLALKDDGASWKYYARVS